MKNSQNIAVLMTCYNRVETTLACLNRLFCQELPEGYCLDVWLVDDASPDGTGDKVLSWSRAHQSAAIADFHLIRSSGGLFWCKGMRLAWDSAIRHTKNYSFYLWLNDDVMLKEDAVTGLLSDSKLVSGVVVGTFSSDESESDVSYGATCSRPDGTPRPGDCGMNGNLVLIPKEVYEKIGPICGGYHHQYGDYDYGLQLRRKGFEFYSSSRFCGVCPEQPERYLHLKDRSLWDRWKLLFNPKGYSLHDAFLYRYRNWGLMRALMSLVHIFLIVTFAREEER